MSDRLLFAVAPYLAAGVLALAFAIRCAHMLASGVRDHDEDHKGACDPRRGLFSTARRVAFGFVLAGHAALVVAPSAVLRWNRSVERLLLLEGSTACLGIVCVAVAAIAWFKAMRLSPHERPLPSPDVMVLTIVVLTSASGLALAIADRWASSWAAVTLAPYIVSIVTARPRVELVTATPFLVRLHVFSTFAILAVAPFTKFAAKAAVPVLTPIRAAADLVAPMCRSISTSAADWARRNVRSLSIESEEES